MHWPLSRPSNYDEPIMPPPPGAVQSPAPFKVFYSYARKDADLRQALAKHLTPLRDEGLITDWYDDGVELGQDFNAEIRAKLEEADLILLLVDVDFLSSEYIKTHELPVALEREKEGRARVVPILVDYFENWRRHVLFANRQSPVSGGTGIKQRRGRNLALAKVAEGIRVVVEKWRKEPGVVIDPGPIPPSPRPCHIAFVYKPPFDDALFQTIRTNPFKDHFDPADADQNGDVRASLWLPNTSELRGDLPSYTTMVAVCDAGGPSDMTAVPTEVQEYYKLPVSELKPEQREGFAEVAGKVLSGTLVVVAAVPRLLLGNRVGSAALAYQVLLNLMLVPLASGLAALHFRQIRLQLNRTDPKSEFPVAHAKKVLRTQFGAGQFDVVQPKPADPEYFHLYAAQFVRWAANRHFNYATSDWLDRLQEKYFA
ncbi:toll/interleukin-1 receptor domain-containing protein [bacterium]|nr:toll/interleukin-1 receptor domain-containing protein [bacterium]